MNHITMHPRISVSAATSRQWTLEQDLAFYKSAGIKTVGIFHLKLKSNEIAGIEAINKAKLDCAYVIGGEMYASLITPSHDGVSTALKGLKPAIDAAAALGRPPCYFTSGSTPPRMPTDDAYNALVESLRPAIDYARTKGVPMAIENNGTSVRDLGFIHTLRDAVELSRELDIGICVELYNCWMERHLDQLFKENADRFVVVQVSDFRVGEPPRFNRSVPGDGDMPLEWLLDRLLNAGYEGLFDLEYMGPKIEEEGYESAIRRGAEWLSERLSKWGV